MEFNLKFIKVFILLLCIADSTLCGTYYVASGGNDWGPGTFDEPWETMGKAAGASVAGDTVLMASSGAGENYIVVLQKVPPILIQNIQNSF